jgi:anti-anti-sigma regulatory factor
MNVDFRQKGSYEIIRVCQDLTIHHNPGPLKQFAAEALKQGRRNVAFSFAPETFPSSRLIAVLVSCAQMIRMHKGIMAVVIPNEKMAEAFRILNLAHNDCFIAVHDEEELLEEDSQ